MNNYNLKNQKNEETFWQSVRSLSPFLKGEVLMVSAALFFVLVNSAITVLVPFFIGDAADTYIPTGDVDGLVRTVFILLGMYIIAFVANFLQIRIMGKVGQNILFKLREGIFSTLQKLPLSFFNQNDTGDVISRINNDTDKLNQAFSEVLLRFLGQIFIILGIGYVMLRVRLDLALLVLSMSIVLLVITAFSRQWIRAKNKENLQANGELSAQVQEGISNFKVLVTFGRRDFLRDEFGKVNESQRQKARIAGIANGILTPFFDLASYISTIIVVVVGLELVFQGEISFGVLLSFILYAERFYRPIRILAQLFTSIQTSLAAWTRIHSILQLSTNVKYPSKEECIDEKVKSIESISLEKVSFGYSEDSEVFSDVSFSLEKGKTYALVGPTGGGKSTIAALISRLYDVTEGEISINSHNITEFSRDWLSKRIGFILQDPFLFNGTLWENIAYGNPDLKDATKNEVGELLEKEGYTKFIQRFPDGLYTKVRNDSENISLGQKQLVAFMRAVIRKPDMLILDEATANIDTITETYLDEILKTLPASTIKLVIAHRLNTIKNADKIFFVAGGKVEEAEDVGDAVSRIQKSGSQS